MQNHAADSSRFAGAARWLGLPGHYRPSTLSEQAVRDLWSFRVSVMGLRPEIDPEEDFAGFRECLRRCELVWVDESEGRVVGMNAMVLRAFEHEGQRVALWEPEYTCISPHRRKSWKIVASALASAAYVFVRHPGHRVYIFGAGYLPSFLMLSHVGPVHLADAPAMSSWERSLFVRLASEYPGWDPSTGTIALPTLPVSPRTSPPRDPRLREPWERYLARNPRWYEGRASALLMRLDGLQGRILREAWDLTRARVLPRGRLTARVAR